jgi:hypothetical protein
MPATSNATNAARTRRNCEKPDILAPIHLEPRYLPGFKPAQREDFKTKTAVAFLKKSSAKDFYESGPRAVSQARSRLKKFFWFFLFTKRTACYSLL